MATYGDFFAAADAILEHVQQTGHRVESFDDPMRLLIGFRCTSEPEELSWQVRLTTIKQIALPDEGENEAIRSYLRTTENRALMAEAFSEGRRIWVRAEPLPAA